MVKIKVKKEMNLPELIEWGFENKVFNKEFTSNYLKSKTVSFDPRGRISFSSMYVYDVEDNFTVEVEEDITEETAIPRLLEVRNLIPLKNTEWHYFKSLKSYLHVNHSISEVENRHSIAFYMLNDDMTMTLLWRNGEMVE
ncbi:hypothetical protein [Staphylococcus chromogenes]|uniref:hypothetical protein n=1 Tax=Staphylococcus chromogenes TaxID=46126 RepID=UPI003B0048D5